MSVPDTQIGLIRDVSGAGHLQSFPVPEPGPNEVLIRNVAVASNPKDWKYPIRLNDYTYIEGNDVAGEIVKLGEGVTGLKAGQRVAAFTRMATKQNKYGAYQQFSVSPAATVIPLPDDLSYEDASTLPLAIFTAAIGLFVKLGLKLIPDVPRGNDDTERKEAVIVYGASSSVGAYVVQLAKLAGYYVIGVAGSSADYAKSIGADAVVDYRKYSGTSELAEAIVNKLSGHPASVGYDAIVTGTSTAAIAHAIVKSTGKGKVTHVAPPKHNEVKSSVPSGVDVELTLVASAYNPEEDEAFIARFSRQLTVYLTATDSKRPLQPNRPKILPNGLASVPEGLTLLQSDQVHGEKLVYRIADTPKSGGA